MLFFILTLKRYKCIIVVTSELHYKGYIFVKLFKTDFLFPEIQFIIFKDINDWGFRFINYWSQVAFIFFRELFSIETFNVYFPEFIETLIFGSFWLEAIECIWEFFVLLLIWLGNLLRWCDGYLRFAFVFFFVILFDMLSFSDGVMFFLRENIGGMVLLKLIFWHWSL